MTQNETILSPPEEGEKKLLYKLTTQDNMTRKGEYNETVWGENVTHSGTGNGDLCGPGYIHAYTHPLLAVFLNPCHANIKNPRLWESEGKVVKSDRGLKVGCIKSDRGLKVAFAILCAKKVYKTPDGIFGLISG